MPEGLGRGRVAIVTGGARRIGRAICRALARAGWTVIVHAHRSTLEVDELVGELALLDARSRSVIADLSRLHEVEGLIGRAAAQAGPLSLLVNNASVFEDDAVGALEALRWERHFAVNLTAPVFLAQAFAAQVPAGTDAAIVNITDQRAQKLVPRQFSYTLTKSALDSATIMLAQALAPQVRVNAVAPGPTLASPRQNPHDFARQQAALPLEAGPSPDDIAAAVTYLASAARVTGVTLAVDGGQHIAWKTPDAWGISE